MSTCSEYANLLDNVPFYSVKVEFDNYIPGCLKIAKIVRPEWELMDIKCKTFNAGYMNHVVACYVTDFKNAIVVRVFGVRDDMDAYINRKNEILIGQSLAEHGVSPELHCVFENGVCTRYIDGQHYNWNMEELTKLQQDEKACRAIFKTAAILHSKKTRKTLEKYGVKMNDEIFQLELLDNLFHNHYPDQVTDQKKLQRMKELPSKKEFFEELQFLKNMAKNSNMKSVYGNLDINPSNFVYIREEDKAYIVDLELCGNNVIGIDLASFIGGLWFGLELNQPALTPDENWLRKWIRVYLETALSLGDHEGTSVTESDVEKLQAELIFGLMVRHYVLGFFIFTNCKNETPFFPDKTIDDLTWSKASMERYFAMKKNIASNEEFQKYFPKL